jgi:hypothetical protein
MNIGDEILINQFAQGVQSLDAILKQFAFLNLAQKRGYLRDLIYLIIQSKAIDDDANVAIKNSGLKPTFTASVLLRKGVRKDNLYRMAELPENELEKVFILFANLFSVAYKRRFFEEKNDPNKWWYWDLSRPEVIEKIKNTALHGE